MHESGTAAGTGLGMETSTVESPLSCRREQPGEVPVTWLSSFPGHRLICQRGADSCDSSMSLVPYCWHRGCSLGLPGQTRTSLCHTGARQLPLEEEMVVVAATGCLPVLCGQELPLALWVAVPVCHPTPEIAALAVALLPLGSGQRGSAACGTGCLCQGWRSSGVQGNSGQWC